MLSILFTRNNTMISRVIRFFTKSEVSHCMLGTELYGTQVVVEASFDGIRILPRQSILKNNEIVKEFLFRQDYKPDIEHILSFLGIKYSYHKLLGNLFIVLGKYLEIKIQNPFGNAEELICTEFIMLTDKNKMIDEWKDLPSHSISPHDLMELCIKSSNFKEIT